MNILCMPRSLFVSILSILFFLYAYNENLSTNYEVFCGRSDCIWYAERFVATF